jgi:hypothetical protein
VPDPLGDQHLALATEAAAVLFLGSWCLDHRAHPRFAPLVRQQRANQRIAIDPVSLRPPAPTGCCDRGRIDDVAFDPFILQRAIDPESIEACLLNDDEREDLPRPRPRFLPKLHKALQ